MAASVNGIPGIFSNTGQSTISNNGILYSFNSGDINFLSALSVVSRAIISKPDIGTYATASSVTTEKETVYDLLLGTGHDLTLDSNDLGVATIENIVVHRLSIRLQFLFDEWFLDKSKGLPYTQFIFKNGSELSDIYSLFYTEIQNTSGVENITSLELVHNKEIATLTIDFAVNEGTISDTIEVSI